MAQDVNITMTYGAVQEIEVTYRELDGGEAGDPIDVTGWAGQFRFSTCGDTIYGTTRLTKAATVGTTDGRFSCDVLAAELETLGPFLGTSGCISPARWSLWVTPPASAAYPIVRGWAFLQPEGSFVTPAEATVLDESFSATVTSLGSRGGPGPQGPPGTGTEPSDGSVTTTSRTVTTIQTIDLSAYLNKNWTIEVETTAETSTARSMWKHLITGFTASDGTTTHEDAEEIVAANRSSLGQPLFEDANAALLHRVKASTTTSTKWAPSARVTQTWNP